MAGPALNDYGYTHPTKPIEVTQNSLNIKYPGGDPNKSPASGYEWKGSGTPESGKGNWYNSQIGEMYHPNFNHGDPIGPHWDYTDAKGVEYRIIPDGSMIPKKGGN